MVPIVNEGNLFDFNFGVTDLSWPEPIKTVAEFGISAVKALFTMGKDGLGYRGLGKAHADISVFSTLVAIGRSGGPTSPMSLN